MSEKQAARHEVNWGADEIKFPRMIQRRGKKESNLSICLHPLPFLDPDRNVEQITYLASNRSWNHQKGRKIAKRPQRGIFHHS